MQTKVGTRIGDYTLVRPLGTGGMGEVWLASCDGLEKPFVIKLLLPQFSRHTSHRRRFLREAKLVASLPHGRIVPVVDYGEASGRLFLVMAFVDGVNLQTFFDALTARGVQLPFTVIAYILAEILEALRDAHTHTVDGELRPVIHRDVKPSNVLISSRGGVFLTDFGIALLDTDYSLETFGTLAYMAPEQARGSSRPQPQCDIFGVGGIAHFLLTGVAPRRIRNTAELDDELDRPPPPTGRDDVPRVLEILRISALDPSSSTRAGNAGDLLALIDEWEGYRRATTPLMEFYQRVIGGMRSGMTEMLAKARAEQPRQITTTMRARPPQDPAQVEEQEQEQEQEQGQEQEQEKPAQDGWRPWWSGDDDDADLDDVTVQYEPRPQPQLLGRRNLNLKGVPEEYIPRPRGDVDDDAPKIRRRPRGVRPGHQDPVVAKLDTTQPLPPLAACDEIAGREEHDGGGP